MILARARQLADVKKEDGFSALHLAALNNHYEVAEILIKEVTTNIYISVSQDVLAGTEQLCRKNHLQREAWRRDERQIKMPSSLMCLSVHFYILNLVNVHCTYSLESSQI